MLDKIQAAVKYLLKDHRDLSARLERIEKVKPVVINGKDGRDAPTIEEVVEAVLAHIPTPKDGESPDPKAIVNDVLAQMPTPRDGKDGRDAPAVNVSDVAAIVLAKLPTPKNGKDGRDAPELSTIVKSVKAQIKTPEPGRPGKDGKNGRDGKNGVSVTKVELERNKLFVWLDGVKKLVGEIKVPAAPSAPFSPGGGMGYASKAEPQNVELKTLGIFATAATQTPTGLGDAGKIRVNFGPGGDTVDGEFTVAPDGLVTCNKNSIQYDFGLSFRVARNGGAGESEIMGRFMYAADGVEANAIQVGDTFAVKIDDDDTVWRESFELRFSPAVGSVIWFEIARNPGSNNSGQLETVQPGGDLSGWNQSNTASITFGKLVTF